VCRMAALGWAPRLVNSSTIARSRPVGGTRWSGCLPIRRRCTALRAVRERGHEDAEHHLVRAVTEEVAQQPRRELGGRQLQRDHRQSQQQRSESARCRVRGSSYGDSGRLPAVVADVLVEYHLTGPPLSLRPALGVARWWVARALDATMTRGSFQVDRHAGLGRHTWATSSSATAGPTRSMSTG
jgi:hypothetical protein